jgi:hypothetical protein
MSDQPSSEKQVSSPKYWPEPWEIALAVAFVLVGVPVIAVATQVGGWLGWVIVWGVLVVGACLVTCKYANTNSVMWFVLLGFMAPRPSDVWVRQTVGEGWVIDTGISVVVTVIGGSIFAIAASFFTVIAKRHKSSSAG